MDELYSEKLILQKYLKEGKRFPSKVKRFLKPKHKNPLDEEVLGVYRPFDRKKLVTADLDVINDFMNTTGEMPTFLEAGPRAKIAIEEPRKRKKTLIVAIVTAGGLAPGINNVVHSIVERHLDVYGELFDQEGGVWGIRDSFKGMVGKTPNWIQLDKKMTEGWIDKGGSELGSIRYRELDLETLTTTIATNIERWNIDILYVIGGDGSLTTAHGIARKTKNTIVVGIPKTMDNDILWIWQSFGFDTAFERASEFINTMHCEAESTRRACILEFFGAQSGFVAANAALASGHVNLVLIPEIFENMKVLKIEETLRIYADHLEKLTRRERKKPHLVIVIAEGVGKVLAKHGVKINGIPVKEKDFPRQFGEFLNLRNMADEKVATFNLQPRYYIRAVPANSHDREFCQRLGALAVDNALAGYTDFMISQWLTGYVLVPLTLVAGKQKRVPVDGIFWKQVVADTGQPPIV